MPRFAEKFCSSPVEATASGGQPHCGSVRRARRLPLLTSTATPPQQPPPAAVAAWLATTGLAAIGMPLSALLVSAPDWPGHRLTAVARLAAEADVARR